MTVPLYLFAQALEVELKYREMGVEGISDSRILHTEMKYYVHPKGGCSAWIER